MIAGVRPYRIVVPTRDSAGWVGLFAAAYRRLGVAPLYLCDSRSADATRAVLERLGAEVVVVTPNANRVEAMLGFAREAVGASGSSASTTMNCLRPRSSVGWTGNYRR
jgi:hypothetical protein